MVVEATIVLPLLPSNSMRVCSLHVLAMIVTARSVPRVAMERVKSLASPPRCLKAFL